MNQTIYLPDEQTLCQFGEQLMQAICQSSFSQGIVIYLKGDLGAGKTTLSRSMIQSLGHT